MSAPYAPNATFCNTTWGANSLYSPPTTADWCISTSVYGSNSTAFIDCCGGLTLANYTVFDQGCSWFCTFDSLAAFDVAFQCVQQERIDFNWVNATAKTSGAGSTRKMGWAGWALVGTTVVGMMVGLPSL